MVRSREQKRAWRAWRGCVVLIVLAALGVFALITDGAPARLPRQTVLVSRRSANPATLATGISTTTTTGAPAPTSP